MSSTPFRIAIPAAVAAIVTGLWWQRTAHGQETGPAWEYATVEGFFDGTQRNLRFYGANICYHGTDGCRWETIRVSVRQWGQINDAVAAATARLGEHGWEIVTTTQVSDGWSQSYTLKRRRTGAQ